MAYISPKIVFPHIMKTGGTSLIAWIQRHYHTNEILYASTWWDLYHSEVDSLECKRFVRGHFGSGILDLFNEVNGFSVIALMRDPIARVLSHYHHIKKAPDVPSDLRFARDPGFSLEDFIEHPMTRSFASNYQVYNYSRFCIDRQSTPSAPPFNEYSGVNHLGEDDLDCAKSFIDRCSVVGVTEDMRGFINALSNYFGFFPEENMVHHRSYNEKIHVSPETMSKLHELNRLDQSLYDYTLARCKLGFSMNGISAKNPNVLRPGESIQWKAGMPFWGSGWDDVMIASPPHIWSVWPEATFNIDVEMVARVAIIFRICRFVTHMQSMAFSVYVNDAKVNPVGLDVGKDGSGSYLVLFENLNCSVLTLKFKVGHMVSFAEVDKSSSDSLKRGVALEGLRLIDASSCQAPDGCAVQ